ncbi:Uncharacterised protein [Bordetella pertussis]|nr:Uncharacterised protein [Bordetella pertussis]
MVARSRAGIRPRCPYWWSRSKACASSTNTFRMPVSWKSSSEVSSVSEATGRSPRTWASASAEASMVPPTQKPSALTCGWPLMSLATASALSTASSRYSLQVAVSTPSVSAASGLRHEMMNTVWPCSTAYRTKEFSGCRSRM